MHRRIIAVVPIFPKISETFIISKFLGLLERGWDVHIVCNHFEAGTWELFPQLAANPRAKKHVHQAWPRQSRWLAGLLWLPALLWCLFFTPRSTWRYLRSGRRRFGMAIFKLFYLDASLIRLRPGILHFEFGSLAVGKMHLKELLNTKLSVSFRGFDINYVGLNQPDYYQQVWETVDAAHLLGEDLWKRAQQRGAPDDLTHTLIPPAIDLTLFPETLPNNTEKLGTPERPFRIISVGRLHWKKGYEFNLQAVKGLIDQGLLCKYEIIGDGDYEAALYYARHQLGLDEVVTFCGGMPHSQVIEHYKKADVFLHGAVSEGFCNAVLEAQAMGVPVVCTDADGLRENIQDRMTGFVVPRREPTAMAEKLLRLAHEGSLRREMGAAGRRRVENHFRMDQQLDAFEAFYERL